MSRWRRLIALGVTALLVPSALPAIGQDATPFTANPLIAPAPEGVPDVASNFDRSTQIERDQSPVGRANEVVDAFQFICQPGQLNWDDPIVYPGQPGACQHLHQCFGNALGNARSTYRALRSAGESSCMGRSTGRHIGCRRCSTAAGMSSDPIGYRSITNACR